MIHSVSSTKFPTCLKMNNLQLKEFHDKTLEGARSGYTFLQHLAAKVSDTPSKPVIGSDYEKAIRKAINIAFPYVPHLMYPAPAQQYIRDCNLVDKIGYFKTTKTGNTQFEFCWTTRNCHFWHFCHIWRTRGCNQGNYLPGYCSWIHKLFRGPY